MGILKNKNFKWLIVCLLVFWVGVGGLLLLKIWLITLDERGVAPSSVYALLLDGQLRRLPHLEGLTLQGHDLIATDGESVGFDRSNYRVNRHDFDLSRWFDYWMKLGYVEAPQVNAPLCSYSLANFERQEMAKSVCLNMDDRNICFEYSHEGVRENFKCPAPSIFGDETCVTGYPQYSGYSIYYEEKIRYKYVQICSDIENGLITVSKSE
jgi:hypothetical protein